MMVKVLLYGYCTGIYSSRRMAEKLVDSVAFRFLAAGNQPDFRTKIKANVSKHKAMSCRRNWREGRCA